MLLPHRRFSTLGSQGKINQVMMVPRKYIGQFRLLALMHAHFNMMKQNQDHNVGSNQRLDRHEISERIHEKKAVAEEI